jgi:hypothetical protein
MSNPPPLTIDGRLPNDVLDKVAKEAAAKVPTVSSLAMNKPSSAIEGRLRNDVLDDSRCEGTDILTQCD